MCSNRRRIFSTVKFRIAFWYAVLFAVTGAVSLAFVFVELRRTMLRGIDRALERGVRNYQIEYLTGKRHQLFFAARQEMLCGCNLTGTPFSFR